MRLTFIFILITASLSAQNLKRFQVNLGFGNGAGWPAFNNASSSALLFYIEPSLRVNTTVAVGFKAEIGFGNINIGSYGPLAMYYFSNKPFKTFAGLGLGLYHPYKGSNSNTGTGPYTTDEHDQLGIYPRLGMAFKHLTLTIDYNIVPKTTVLIHDNNSVQAANINCSYLAAKFGVTIGGGRKKSN